jgi:hypothetical protein
MDTTAEITDLRAQLAEREAELVAANLLIEQYKAQLRKLRRMQLWGLQCNTITDLGKVEIVHIQNSNHRLYTRVRTHSLR